MKRLAAILVSLCFLAIGSGAAEFAHNLQHAREDALAHRDNSKTPAHDENNCAVHAQLHAPALAGSWLPLLVFLGLFVAFLTQIAPELVSHRATFRIACRGPPAC